jgi:hypothetical protein
MKGFTNMRKIGSLIFVVCLLLLMTGNSLAQSKQVEASRKVDEFSGANCEDLEARLDHFAIELQNHPDLLGYIIIYGGNHGKRDEARAWMGRTKYYLSTNRGVDTGRFNILMGGYRENWAMELWLLQSNVPKPIAKPTLQLKDVKFKRGRIARSQYRHCGEI